MESVISFIRDFDILSYGLDGWDVIMLIASTIFACYLLMRIASFLPPSKADLTKKILTFIFHLIAYGVIAFALLNSYLIKDYGRMAVIIFIIMIPSLRRWVANLYNRYDGWVDRIADRNK